MSDFYYGAPKTHAIRPQTSRATMPQSYYNDSRLQTQTYFAARSERITTVPHSTRGLQPNIFPDAPDATTTKALYSRRIHPPQANIACARKAAGQNAGNARNARTRPPRANQLAAKRRKSPNQTVGFRHTTLSRRLSQKRLTSLFRQREWQKTTPIRNLQDLACIPARPQSHLR